MPRRDLKTRLAEATRRAWERLRADHPGERFYFFALYTWPDGVHVGPTAWSEEAFAAADDRNLRFSAPDSPYHEFTDEGFDLPKGPKLHAACFAALQALDAAGVFGRGKQREALVLNVVYGDMSDEEWLAHAELLNPPAAVMRALPYLQLHRPSGAVQAWGPGVGGADALSTSADRRLVAYSSSGGDVGVYRSRKAVLERHGRGEHWASVLDPGGERLYLGDEQGVLVLPLPAGKATRLVKQPKPGALAISADGKWLACASWDAPLRMLATTDGKPRWQLPRTGNVEPAFSPDGKWLAFDTGSLRVVDARTGKPKARARRDGDDGRGPVAWAPDGRTLASRAPGSAAVALWAWPGLKKIAELGPAIVVDALAFSPSGERLAYTSGDLIAVVDRAWRELARGTGTQEQLDRCVFLDEDTVLAVGCDVNRGPVFLELTTD